MTTTLATDKNVSFLYPRVIAEAPPEVQAAFDAVHAEDDADRALKREQDTQIKNLRDARTKLVNERERIAAAKQTDETKKRLAALNKQHEEIDSKIAAIRALQERQRRISWAARVDDALMGFRGKLERAIDVPEWKPDKDEDLETAYAKAFKQVNTLAKRANEINNTPLPLSEQVSNLKNYLDAIAKAPDAADFAIRDRYDRTLGLPHMNLSAVVHDFNNTPATGIVTVPDVWAVMAWLFRDQIVAKLRKEIEANGNASDKIPTEKFGETYEDAKAALLHAQRVCESAYQVCKQHGLRLNRPRSTPPCVILGVEPFER